MNNNPDCHPENSESGQQIITIAHRGTLADITRDAYTLIQEAQSARLASLCDDNKRALRALNEARFYAECIIDAFKTLPPTEDFPENEQ